MNLHALRVFHSIARLGSVTRAAEELHISQPAVTVQLRNLEKAHGLPLTRSQGRGIVLTEAGEWLAAQADRLFALEADISSSMEAVRTGRLGSLKLAATYLPANFLLPRMLARFRSAYPDVACTVMTSNAQIACERLLRYEADIAIIGSIRTFPPDVRCDLLLEDALSIVATPDHPLVGQSVPLSRLVRDTTFVLREPGSSTRDTLFALCRARGIAPPEATLQFSGPQETIRAAIAGLGVTLASSLEIQEHIAAGSLVRLDVSDAAAVNPIWCCTRTNDPLSPQAAAFMNCCYPIA
ncbi:LysR family transcriptional regulator [Cohnella boryungensis]|uniref:LysR family transcriptional regulator n=1 Tax=Cohnella boryungensis TaxID=768479 RepID=A0ABV8S8N1_9BACL